MRGDAIEVTATDRPSARRLCYALLVIGPARGRRMEEVRARHLPPRTKEAARHVAPCQENGEGSMPRTKPKPEPSISTLTAPRAALAPAVRTRAPCAMLAGMVSGL